MMIGLCVRVGDSTVCFIHTVNVSEQSVIREHSTLLISEGVTLLILTEPISFFFLRIAI